MVELPFELAVVDFGVPGADNEKRPVLMEKGEGLANAGRFTTHSLRPPAPQWRWRRQTPESDLPALSPGKGAHLSIAMLPGPLSLFSLGQERSTAMIKRLWTPYR